MGYYINYVQGFSLPASGKANYLVENANATIISKPTEFVENLVCVIDNLLFDAAAYCYNETEMFDFFETLSDRRPRTWLIVPDANKLSGFEK